MRTLIVITVTAIIGTLIYIGIREGVFSRVAKSVTGETGVKDPADGSKIPPVTT